MQDLPLKEVGFAAIVGAGLVGTILVVTTLAGLTFDGDDTAESDSGADNGGDLLLTANRDQLAICVDAPGGSPATAAEAGEAIEAVYPEIAADPYWARADLTSAVREPRVDVGCPSEPFLLQPGALSEEGAVNSIPEVAEASYYRVFVFVLPAEDIEELPVNTHGRAVQESLRSGRDVYGEVTPGLYLTVEQVRDREHLVDSLMRAIGLKHP